MTRNNKASFAEKKEDEEYDNHYEAKDNGY